MRNAKYTAVQPREKLGKILCPHVSWSPGCEKILGKQCAFFLDDVTVHVFGHGAGEYSWSPSRQEIRLAHAVRIKCFLGRPSIFLPHKLGPAIADSKQAMLCPQPQKKRLDARSLPVQKLSASKGEVTCFHHAPEYAHLDIRLPLSSDISKL